MEEENTVSEFAERRTEVAQKEHKGVVVLGWGRGQRSRAASKENCTLRNVNRGEKWHKKMIASDKAIRYVLQTRSCENKRAKQRRRKEPLEL